MQIDHFKPQWKYPQLTFDWHNFVPSCTVCNTNKGRHDTLVMPFINPSKIDPKTCFTFDSISITPKGRHAAEAKKAIEVLGLDRDALMKRRADLLPSLNRFRNIVRDALLRIAEAQTERKKAIILKALLSAFEGIFAEYGTSSEMPLFVFNFLRSDPCIMNALAMIRSAHRVDWFL